MILIGVAVIAIVVLLILRMPSNAEPTDSGLPKITFDAGKTIEVQGEIPTATRRELSEIARMFRTTGSLTLVKPGEVNFSSQISDSDRQRFMNVLAATWAALPKPST